MPLLRNSPELLLAFREGKPAAFEKVYHHYVRPLDTYFRALARMAGTPELGQPSAIADLLQEAFVHAFSKSARLAYDGLRDFSPYLNTIARHCFVDVLRKRHKEILIGLEDLPLDAADAPAGDDDYDPLVVAVLENYLRDLSAPLQGVYEQRFVRGLSQDAACQSLGVSRRTLRTAEAHLRGGLRKALLMAGMLHGSSRRVVNKLEASRP